MPRLVKPMKKAFLCLLLSMLAIQVFSISGSIIAIPMPSFDSANLPKDRLAWVNNISDRGLQVFYYNEYYLLAGAHDISLPGSIPLCGTETEGLYLLSVREKDAASPIPTQCSLLLDMKTSLLIQTGLRESELRRCYPGQVMRLSKEPLKLEYPGIHVPRPTQTSDFVTNLLDLVSQDSLMAYTQDLQDFQTRYAMAENRLAIANWLKGKFQSFGYTDACLDSLPWEDDYQYNVIARLPGSVYPDSYVLVGGHYDSQNWHGDPMVLAPGADDNGTGVAALLEIARIMKAGDYQPRCSILFIPLAAEEIGCIGTYGYVEHAQQTGMDIRLMVNMDMIGNTSPYPDDPRMLLHSYDGCLEHAYYASGLVNLYTGLTAVMGPLNAFITDSYLFWEFGFPAISFDEFWMSPVYHSSYDNTDHLDPEYFTKMARSVAAMATHYSYLSSPPTGLMAADTGTGGSLMVTWDASADPLVDHYMIRWGTTEWNYTHEARTYSNQFIITRLPEGETCHIAVSAADEDGLESYQTTASGIPMSIPRIPSGFTDSPQPGAIELSWEPNQELDIAGYRLYRSLSEDEQGELIAFIPASRIEYLDEGLPGLPAYYCYRLCALDADGNEGPFTEVLKSRPVTLDNGILIIDETMDYAGTNPFQPTDAAVDSFFGSVTEGLPVAAELDLENYAGPLRLADLCIYSTLLWHGNDFGDFTRPSEARKILDDYIALGGKVLFSVCHPSQAFELNGAFPAYFGSDTFLNQVLGVQEAHYSPAARFRYAVPLLAGLPDLMVDSLKTPGFFLGHIFHVEGLVPVSDAEAFYSYGSDYAQSTAQGVMNNEYVAIRHDHGSGQAVLLSYPLYFIQEVEARELVQLILGVWFGEAVSVDDANYIPEGPTVSLPYPNPFRDRICFSISGANTREPLTLKIYNLKGQLVKSLSSVSERADIDLYWDGTDSQDRQLGSGLYLYEVGQAGKASQGKMLYLK
jgi:hypothetical protein